MVISDGEYLLVGGWAYPSEKYEFVSWDDEIPNIWKKLKMFQTTNQMGMGLGMTPCFFWGGNYGEHRLEP